MEVILSDCAYLENSYDAFGVHIRNGGFGDYWSRIKVRNFYRKGMKWKDYMSSLL